MEIDWDRKIEGLGSLRAQLSACPSLPDRLSRHYRHPFDIRCHGDQVPLTSHRVQSAQQELPKAHHGFDNAKHWLDSLLSQTIELSSLNRFEPVFHPKLGS